MKLNPICKREIMVSGRSSRTAVMITVFNAVLALVALIYMNYVLGEVRVTGQIRYQAFLTIFRYIAWIELIMILLVMPALTSGSISGERERGTLDLILATKMTPADILLGKLMTSFYSVFLLILSSAPVMALVFVYGGVTGKDMLVLFFCFFTAALLCGSIGIWFSGLLRKTTAATASAYGLEGILFLGTIGINMMFRNISAVSKGSFMLMLFSPVSVFYAAVGRMTGDGNAVRNFAENYGISGSGFLSTHWIVLGSAVQILLSCLLIFLAARALRRPFRALKNSRKV